MKSNYFFKTCFHLVSYTHTDSIRPSYEGLEIYREEVKRAFTWRNQDQYCIDRKKKLWEIAYERRKFLKRTLF